MFLVLKWDDGHHWFLIQLVDNNLRKILTISRITLLNSFLTYIPSFPVMSISLSYFCRMHKFGWFWHKNDSKIIAGIKVGIYVISIFIFYLLLKFHLLSSEPKWRVFYFSSGGSLGRVSYKCNAYVWLLVGIKTFTFSIVIINSFI
jgi:hypothetical protein